MAFYVGRTPDSHVTLRRVAIVAPLIALVVMWLAWGSLGVKATTIEHSGEVGATSVKDHYPWHGAYDCGTQWVSIDLQIYLRPGASLAARWESSTGNGYTVIMTRGADQAAGWFRLNHQTTPAATIGGTGVRPAGGNLAFHIYPAVTTSNPEGVTSAFDVKDVRVYSEKDSSSPWCAPNTTVTPPPVNPAPTREPGVTAPPNPDPTVNTGTPTPSPAGQTPSPSPGNLTCVEIAPGVIGQCFEATPSPTPSPTPPTATCVDLNQPQTVQLRLNASPTVTFTGDGMAGLPVCKYPIGPTGSPQWDWEVRLLFTKHTYQNLGSGDLGSFLISWTHGYFADPPEGTPVACTGSSGVVTTTISNVHTQANGTTQTGPFSDYAPAVACGDGGNPRYLAPAVGIGGSCSGTCDIVTATIQLQWQQPGGLPTPSPTPQSTPSPSPTSSPPPATASPPTFPGGGGGGTGSPNPLPSGGGGGGGGVQQPGTGTPGDTPGGTGGMGSPLSGEVAGGCTVTYPKPGQVAYSNPAPVPFPGLSIDVPAWLNWIGSILNVLPTAIGNSVAWLWNAFIDLLVPSNCFGPALQAYLQATGEEPPFVWFTSASASITASLAGGSGVSIPDLTIGGATIQTSDVLDGALAAIAPFRGFFAAAVAMAAAFAVLRWVGSVVNLRAGKGGDGDAD